jgi:hypothetical protein
MRKLLAISAVTLSLSLSTQVVSAQEGETWETQEEVYNVTLIKIHPNMGEQYLNNLRRTWVTGVEEAVAEGITLEYGIYASITPNDGGYNLLLVTKHPNLAALDATDAWRQKLAAINERVLAMLSDEESDRITTTVYPEVRTILSNKMLREIKFIE